MHKQLILVLFTCLFSCNNGKLNPLAELPTALNEASGIETTAYSDLIWMMNDSGNASKLYAVNEKGIIQKKLNINSKNNDWEDLTSDDKGNIYIGDFGNNNNNRKNLAVLKVNKDSLNDPDEIEVERILFKYPNQKKFPPKKRQLYFDCEAFFYYKDSLFLFTKSRVHNNFGQTSLYKIPAKPGNYIAQYISTFNTCSDMGCWITGADISKDGKHVVLLSPKAVWVFTDYKGSNFFSGTATKVELNHDSQKEGICFKNENTLYIADEKAHGFDGNLYTLKLKFITN